MCLREGGAKAHEVPDQQASVEPEGENRQREGLRREMHRVADREWEDRAPGADTGEQQREEGELREADWRPQGVDGKGSSEIECHRERAHRGGLPDNNEVSRKQPRRGAQEDDDEERCKRREKTEATALRRSARKGRSREAGTQEGKLSDPPDD